MKKIFTSPKTHFKITLITLCFILFSFQNYAQLSGNYTIDPSGGGFPNFTSFQAAVDSLLSQGVSGAVTFNAADGTYDEQVKFSDSIAGASVTNTITFQSQSGDSSLVEVTYSADETDNYVVELVNTDYITFRNITFTNTRISYSHVFSFQGNLDSVTISNCVINGTDYYSESFGDDDRAAVYAGFAILNNITIKNNVFSGGTYGIWLICDTQNKGTGTEIKNNTFTDQHNEAIFLEHLDAPEIDSNYIENTLDQGNFKGISLNDCINDLKVRKNIIISSRGIAGISLYFCAGTASNQGLVSNNFITIGNPNYAYGIHTDYSNYQRIYYNSVRVISTNTDYGRAYYNAGGAASDIDIQNNIFSNPGGGYAYYAENTTGIVTSDYNDLYTTGDNLGYWNGAASDLAAFQAAGGTDANSVSVNPVFVSNTDLHATGSDIDGAGTDLSPVVIDDIDGEDRDPTTPDIGADEFMSISFSLVWTNPDKYDTYEVGDSVHFQWNSSNINEVEIAAYNYNNDIWFSVTEDTSIYANSEKYSIRIPHDIDTGYYDFLIYFVTDSTIQDIVDSVYLEDNRSLNFTNPQNDDTLYVGDSLSIEWNYLKVDSILIAGYDYNLQEGFILTADENEDPVPVAASEGQYELWIDYEANTDSADFFLYDAEDTLSWFDSVRVYLIDTVPPMIEKTTPENGTTGFPPAGQFTLYLTEDVTVGTGEIRLLEIDGTPVDTFNVADIYFDEDLFSFTPDSPLEPGTEYYFEIDAGIATDWKNLDFKAVTGSDTWSFTVASTDLYFSEYVEGSSDNQAIEIYNPTNNIVDLSQYGIVNNYNAGNWNEPTPLSGMLNSKDVYVIAGSNFDFSLIDSAAVVDSVCWDECFITSYDGNDGRALVKLIEGSWAWWNDDCTYSFIDVIGMSGTDPGTGWDVAGVSAATSDHTLLRKATVAIGNTDFTESSGTDTENSEWIVLSNDSVANLGYLTPAPPGLSGEYTIGGTSPDYETFTAAVEDLNALGVEGQVTFKVRTGTYNEQIELLEIDGASATDSIVFQSESGDSTDVTLTYDAASSSGDYLVKLIGTDYITFRNISLNSTDTTYGKVIVLSGSVNNLNILNNIINTTNSIGSSVICSADGSVTNDILIKNNIIEGGGTGIEMNGDDGNKSEYIRILENIISGQADCGIDLEDQKGSVIYGNEINAGEPGYGIYLNDCDEDIIIESNKITNNGISYGVYLYYCDGTVNKQGLIANNFVSVQGDSSAYGIYIDTCQYQNVYYNSVNIASTYSDTDFKKAFYVSGGANINVKNNIFASTKGGYAYYISTAQAISSSDYNDLYSTTDIAYWGSAQTDLSALQAASSKDANSVSADPVFSSGTDLRSAQATLHQAATPLSEVTKDIYGTARDATTPDIGAVEFSCVTPAFNVSVPTGCFGDSSVFIDNSTNVAYGSTYSWDFDGDLEYDTTYSNIPGATLKYLFDASGAHTVHFVIDQIAGCVDTNIINVNVSPTPVLQITTLGAYCDSSNGQASVRVVGDANWDDYTYYWSTGSTDTVAKDLSPGTYTVAVSDSNDCTTTKTVTIDDRMQVTVTELQGSTCGNNNGQAYVTVTGGVPPYQYVWSNGVTNDTCTTLSSGVNYVTIIDANGCYANGSINISIEGEGPEITLVEQSNNNCYGDRNGAIDITVSQGSQPYTILWSNGSSTEDIEDLAAGVYDVIVIDDDSCVTSASYEITQPPELTISVEVEDASCAGSDGKAKAIVSGGTEPYQYSWSTGGTYQIEENLSAGIYSLAVIDSNSCQAVKTVIVNNVGGPVVTIDSVKNVTFSDTTNGAIYINVSEGTPPYSYLWSPGGETTEDIDNLTPGVYEVRVTDDNGCVSVNRAEIKQNPPPVNPICLVTVDSLTRKNLVVWEKEVTTDVDHYNIYRETSQKDVYQLIGSSPVDSLSEFTDTIADPRVRSWRYKLSVVDKSDKESEMSEPHKTMHLTQNVGLNNTVNLIWDHYEGFTFSTYDIYRHSTESGWKKLDSLSSDLTSYTDLNPPSSGTFYYVVEVVRPTSCTATRKTSTHNSSRSNRTTDLTTGVKSEAGNMFELAVYPNPNNGVFTLTFNVEKKEDVTIRLFDVNGRMVHSIKHKDYFGPYRKTLDLSGLGSGSYFMQIISETGIVYTQIVIE